MKEIVDRKIIKEKVKKAPLKPGVYFWLDKKGEVLYVGRATSLRSRLSQYLQKNLERRISEMMSQVFDLRFIETDSLLQAIITEAQEIKRYWPKYNVKDRDDRSFVYIVILQEDYPHPIIIRGQDLKKFSPLKADIFGPYQSYALVKKFLRLIRSVFPYSTCRFNSGQACFDYQIGLCPGVCLGKVTVEDYQKNIKNIKLLLKGEKKRLLTQLLRDNPEKAQALKHLQEVSLLQREDSLVKTRLNRLEGYDISHHGGKESYGAMVVMEEGRLNKSAYRLFKIREAPAADDERALLEVLLRRFNHSEWPLPNLIMIDGGRAQISFLTRELKKHNIETSLVGISKYGGDVLVFSQPSKKQQREIASSLKSSLLQLREEAHRFANYGRRRGSKLKV
ncbi:hypothetical protein EOL99_01860 [Candidatus Falkowbacteria bacterium]|nr:hypothetical protein [Candidatus Falkowbacteria bacterium]